MSNITMKPSLCWQETDFLVSFPFLLVGAGRAHLLSKKLKDHKINPRFQVQIQQRYEE